MGLLETATKAYELAKKAGNIEAQEAIMQLREELGAKQAELHDLKIENERLRQSLKTADELQYEPPYYWRLVNGASKDGPFCQLCWDKNRSLIRLQKGPLNGQWGCQSCENIVTDKTYVDQFVQGVTWAASQ